MNLTKAEWILITIVIIILFVILNIASHFAILNYLNMSIYDEKYQYKQRIFIKRISNDKVHPFYGLTSAKTSGFDSKISVENNFISVSPIKSENPISVLVLGGSVASHLSVARVDIEQEHLLANELNLFFDTDRFTVYNAAFGGGKQPQQYFKLLYLELLGFKPDIIINYDGFNEVALPLGENIKRNTNAIYPRSFDQTLTGTVYDGSCFFLNNWFLSFNTHMPVIELTKWIYIKYCHDKALGNKKIVPLTPESLFEEEQKNYLNRVQLIWKDSSNLIARFAVMHNIPYLHVLQPNQYLVGSKILSNLELEAFYDHPYYRLPIEKYYNSLDLNWLDAQYAIDQRYLFKHEKRTVYSDHCCHFNRIGMEIIIRDLLEKSENMFSRVLAK